MPESLETPNLFQENPTPQQAAPVQESQQQSDFPSLGNEFLHNIPDQDRPIVEKYVRGWDGEVTKRFKEINDRWAPYEALGDLEQVQKAHQIHSYMMNDPIAFYNDYIKIIRELAEEGFIDMPEGFNPQELNQQQNTSEQLETGPQTLPENANIPPEVLKMMQGMQEQISKFSESHSNFERQQAEQAEMAALDNWLKEAHTSHNLGTEGETFVLSQLAAGVSGENALKAWDSFVEKVVGSRPKNTPPNLLAGPGSAPGNQVDPSKLNEQDRVKYITGVLAAQQQS